MSVDKSRFEINMSETHILTELRDLAVDEGVKVADYILKNDLYVCISDTEREGGKDLRLVVIGGDDELYKTIDFQEWIYDNLADFQEPSGKNRLSDKLKKLHFSLPKGT